MKIFAARGAHLRPGIRASACHLPMTPDLFDTPLIAGLRNCEEFIEKHAEEDLIAENPCR